MASVPITELKAHLAKYLRMARRGVEVLVLERGVAVARIVAMPHNDESQDAGIDSLVRAGIVRRGPGRIRSLLRRRLRVSTNLLGALDEDREDRA
ncbi:MAG TPA: type II toxin-antitoxin system prevent-host-death family antitoxin [Polyangiaceae bacterium]|jgi:prevent-host-death family protein|nr:type II toxin-antitoxin system prevent-host-death family antitoxin [Polyangiaceae bacterium]